MNILSCANGLLPASRNKKTHSIKKGLPKSYKTSKIIIRWHAKQITVKVAVDDYLNFPANSSITFFKKLLTNWFLKCYYIEVVTRVRVKH